MVWASGLLWMAWVVWMVWVGEGGQHRRDGEVVARVHVWGRRAFQRAGWKGGQQFRCDGVRRGLGEGRG